MVNNDLLDQLAIQFVSKFLESSEVQSTDQAAEALTTLISIATKGLSDNTSVTKALLTLGTIEAALLEYTQPAAVLLAENIVSVNSDMSLTKTH